jgi:hypothetical protein
MSYRISGQDSHSLSTLGPEAVDQSPCQLSTSLLELCQGERFTVAVRLVENSVRSVVPARLEDVTANVQSRPFRAW